MRQYWLLENLSSASLSTWNAVTDTKSQRDVSQNVVTGAEHPLRLRPTNIPVQKLAGRD